MCLVMLYFFFFILLYCFILFFFFNDTATTEIYTLSLHDALPIYKYQENKSNRNNGIVIENFFKNALNSIRSNKIIYHETIEKHFNFTSLFEQRSISFYLGKPIPVENIYSEYKSSRSYGVKVDVFYPENLESDVLEICSTLTEEKLSTYSRNFNTTKLIKTHGDALKEFGAYDTPEQLVEFIIRWAIRNPKDKILDPSCGDGRFLYSAYNKLLNKNISSKYASKYLFGVEIDPKYYKKTINRKSFCFIFS